MEPPKVYKKRVTGYPKAPLLLSLLASGGLYWLGGLSLWWSLLFGLTQFSLLGGLQFFRLFIKTVPRDIRMMSDRIKFALQFSKKMKQQKLVFDYFDDTAAKFSDKPAIIAIGVNGAPDHTLTFRQLGDYTNKVANHFLSLGLRRGDCVALFLENSPESYALYLGLAKIGVISAMINTNLRGSSLTHCVNVADCSGIVFSSSLGEAVREVMADLDPRSRSLCFSVQGECGSEVRDLEAELAEVSCDPPPPLADKKVTDTILYLYTSGTTGLPKPCKVDDTKLFKVPLMYGICGNITDQDTVYSILPLYHTHGLVHNGGPMIYGGSTLVIRPKFSASNFWTDCIKHNCTVVFTIGEIGRYLVAQPARPTDSQHNIRLIFSIGLRSEIWTQLLNRFKVTRIIESYGSTEGNMGFINSGNKVGSIGAVPLFLPSILNIRFLRINQETGEYIRNEQGFCMECGVDEPGEPVCEIAKISPFNGYRSKEKTEKKILKDVFKKGDSYFRSGDILRVDEEGWVYFCDRIGDTFRWKGENVSTTEVEATMAHILALTDVVVYGVEVPGNEGRAGMAAIVGGEKVLEGLPAQLSLSLPPYAVPLFVRLITAAELTGTFKLQKVKLRNEGWDRDKVSDPLFILRGKDYVPLTSQLAQDLQDGRIRV